MKRISLSILSIIVWFSSCISKDSKVTSTESQYNALFIQRELMDSLKQKVISDNDTTAYYELRDIYILSGHHEEILYFAYSIAYNTDLPVAYFDLSASFPVDHKGRLRFLNEYYALVAHEKGCEDARHLVEKMFGDSTIIPSSKDYLKQYGLDRFDNIIVPVILSSNDSVTK